MDNSRRCNKINLLVVGGSEVRMFVEGRKLLREEYGVNVCVEYQNGCTLDACLEQIRLQMKPTTHLIIIWALTPYGWRRTPICTQGEREITIFHPDIYFSLQPIPGLMNQIMKHVLSVNPNCLVYLAIPSIKDLYTFNQTRIVRAWGDQFRHFLRDHADYNPEKMRKHSVSIYNQFTTLWQDQYRWEGKNLLYCNSALNCYTSCRPAAKHQKKIGVPHRDYLKGVTNILNSELIPDGLHGNQLYFRYFWIRNKSIFDRVREVNNLPRPPKPHIKPLRRSLLGDGPTFTFQPTTAEHRRVVSTSNNNEDNAEFPDRVSSIPYQFTNLDQPSTSYDGLLNQDSFVPPTREGYIASPNTHRQCITHFPSYHIDNSQSFTNPLSDSSLFTEYDSDDADADARATVRDFLDERKRKGYREKRSVIKDLEIIIKNARKEQEILKRRKH
ncbi:UNVERIFIED_CONTAM: hypothetical protein RMT77_019496 [Armadillidium vulgare]